MQQNKRTAIRVFRLMDSMHKRQIAIDHPFLTRQAKLRHTGSDRIRLLLVAWRHEQNLPQRFHWFIQGKAGSIGGKFKQGSSRLADIERCEVFAVMYVDFAGIKL
ncbi:hypothetical protein D9M69_515630 [compost metagenome]